MVQTVYCYYFTAHSTSWTLDFGLDPSRTGPSTSSIPFVRLHQPTWASVPLALRVTFPGASAHALRLTLRRRRLPHRDSMITPDGSPIYPKVTGSQAAHCVWCCTSAHTCRPIAWLLPVRTGLCLRFRRNTQRVLRLVLSTSEADPVAQDDYTVERSAVRSLKGKMANGWFQGWTVQVPALILHFKRFIVPLCCFSL